MAKDRARDARRTVGSHEKIMGALGKAASWSRSDGYSYSSKHKEKGLFAPGHGNVNVGTKSHWEPSQLGTTREIGRLTNRSAGITPFEEKK
jgi:hypothetical protein